jgi:hypothetical protein
MNMISGSSIYRYSGGTGGSFEQFNGIEFYPTTVDNIYDVTQSWDESFDTTLGVVTYDRDDQREFYNGEFSGSDPYVKLQRGLGNEDDPCFASLKINPNDFYVYELEFYGGPDNDFTILSCYCSNPNSNTNSYNYTNSYSYCNSNSNAPTPTLPTIYIKPDIPVTLISGVFYIGGVDIKTAPGYSGIAENSSVVFVSGAEQNGATIYVSSTPFAGNDQLYIAWGSQFNTSVGPPYDFVVLQINNSGIVDTVYDSGGNPI